MIEDRIENEKKENSSNNAKGKAKWNKRILMFVIIGICLVAFAIFISLLVVSSSNKKKCPSNYTLLDDRCAKIETIESKVNKYCIEGYQLENDMCYKIETTTPAVKYYCDDTYKTNGNVVSSKSTLSGSTCSYTLSHEPVQNKKCLPGAQPYSDTKCRATIVTRASTRTDIRTGNIMYYCVGDAVLSGTSCLLYAYTDYIYETICVSDYSLVNGRCVKTYTYEARWEANCPSGYTFIDKNTCTKKVTTDVKYNYECPSDYDLVNKKCQKKIYLDKE